MSMIILPVTYSFIYCLGPTEVLGDCLLNYVMVSDAMAHVCEVQISLTKVEIARDALGGLDSYRY